MYDRKSTRVVEVVPGMAVVDKPTSDIVASYSRYNYRTVTQQEIKGENVRNDLKHITLTPTSSHLSIPTKQDCSSCTSHYLVFLQASVHAFWDMCFGTQLISDL